MKIIPFCFIIVFLIQSNIFAQSPIDIVDITIKLKGKKELYYGFEKGDQIILNFEEKNNKSIKEIEVYRYPDNLKYSNFKTTSVKSKKINVEAKGVFKFVFTNPKSRLCHIKIQRIPASEETVDFNTSVKWIEVADTNKSKNKNVITDQKNNEIQKSRKVLESKEVKLVEVLRTKEQIHSKTYINGPNYNWIKFKLPKNTYSPNKSNPYKVTEITSWAYAIATEGNGTKWYEKAEAEALVSEGGQIAVAAGYISSGYAAIGLLALKGYSTFANPPKGENIKYQLVSEILGLKRTITQGDCILVSKRYTTRNLQGSYALKLENDNLINGINVLVSVYAVQETRIYKDEFYTEQKTNLVKEIKMNKIPVNYN